MINLRISLILISGFNYIQGIKLKKRQVLNKIFPKPHVLTTVQEIRSFILNLSDKDFSAIHELSKKNMGHYVFNMLVVSLLIFLRTNYNYLMFLLKIVYTVEI